MNKITENDIKKIDKSNMYKVLLDFPEQIAEAINIGEHSPAMKPTNDFLVLGMGGSAIGGDILSNYFATTEGLSHIRISVNRDYNIPGYINRNTGIIASSYSGGTEETISALNSATNISKNILCITTGGLLADIADKNNFTKVLIPSGLMPRCALGYSFFTLLKILQKSADITQSTKQTINNEIDNTLSILKEKSVLYSQSDESNPAYRIAKSIVNTIPIVYSSGRLNTVNLRWRAQMQENAKNIAFGNILPEMNHNEINSWSNPQKTLNNFSLLLLRHIKDSDKIIKRMNAVELLLGEKVKQVINVESTAKGNLTRMFDLIYLGDWLSYFLAIFNSEDPTPIPLISKFKEILK